MHRCVLYIPPGRAYTQWHDICARYAASHHYEIVAVASTWAGALAVIAAGTAVIAVIGRRDHLPPDRTPRVEVVCEEQPAVEVPAAKRRPTRRRAPATD